MFITKAETAKAEILRTMEGLSGNYGSTANKLNYVLNVILDLDDEALAEFANDIGPQMVGQISDLHAAHGAASNMMSDTSQAMLAICGKTVSSTQVNILPLAVKLAAQYRELVFDGEKFVVNQLPEPEPEVIPEEETPVDPPVDPEPEVPVEEPVVDPEPVP